MLVSRTFMCVLVVVQTPRMLLQVVLVVLREVLWGRSQPSMAVRGVGVGVAMVAVPGVGVCRVVLCVGSRVTVVTNAAIGMLVEVAMVMPIMMHPRVLQRLLWLAPRMLKRLLWLAPRTLKRLQGGQVCLKRHCTCGCGRRGGYHGSRQRRHGQLYVRTTRLFIHGARWLRSIRCRIQPQLLLVRLGQSGVPISPGGGLGTGQVQM